MLALAGNADPYRTTARVSPSGAHQVTADYTAGDDGELSVALGDQVMLLDTRLGEYARVQDALGNVGKVPSHCIRVHL